MGVDRGAGAGEAPVAEGRSDRGFPFYPGSGEAPLLRGQRASGAGSGGVVQAAVAWLLVRSALGAAAAAGGGGERGLPLVPGGEAAGQGSRCLDPEPDTAAAFCRERALPGARR